MRPKRSNQWRQYLCLDEDNNLCHPWQRRGHHQEPKELLLHTSWHNIIRGQNANIIQFHWPPERFSIFSWWWKERRMPVFFFVCLFVRIRLRRTCRHMHEMNQLWGGWLGRNVLWTTWSMALRRCSSLGAYILGFQRNQELHWRTSLFWILDSWYETLSHLQQQNLLKHL